MKLVVKMKTQAVKVPNLKQSRLIKNKRAVSGFTVFIIVVLLIYILSTQKVVVNDKQLTTASISSCSLIKKAYDPVNKVCIGTSAVVQQTTPNTNQTQTSVTT